MADAVPEEPVPTEERKLATVLFADLVGSTALADDEDPERTRLVLNRFYDAMTEEIERCGGTVEKFAGDAVMAAFGAPAALEDHAERALHAAIAMQRRLTELFGERLALRIGVNTGDVVVGRPREGSSFVTGDAVNVAARLEQAAAPGEILAGERTVAAARGAFEFGDPATIEAKGKPGRRRLPARCSARCRSCGRVACAACHRCSSVARRSSRSSRTDTGASWPTASRTSSPSSATPGVGKTRLIREIWGWLSIAVARADPAHGSHPVIWTGHDVLAHGRGAQGALRHLGERSARRRSPPDSPTDPYLGLTLGLRIEEDLHPLVARERLHDAWVEFLGELACERPVVLLIEDMHWAEDDLCDLIDTLVAQVAGPAVRPRHGAARDARPASGLGRRMAAHVGHARSRRSRRRDRPPPGRTAGCRDPGRDP